ncbi:hypothetical protein Pan216_30500 [Planctomycetes bacterium Pan216]|uniref:Carboxypeptidase regulatory-like domain-containing protein n=1 Tax=Kolteria novifilia TaxID=2527975 RepID=A0A518B5C7_9BACT|nr:hypothetical protein Pan216_30500 [Planctomycetes bacterium Pan216]
MIGRIRWRVALTCFVGLCVVLGSGCGSGGDLPKTVKVTGMITIDGKPVPVGVITFFPEPDVEPNLNAVGHIQPDGSYSLMTFQNAHGVVPGRFKVSIQAWQREPTMEQEGVPLIPEKYFTIDSSGLNAEVSPDQSSQTFDFKLSS